MIGVRNVFFMGLYYIYMFGELEARISCWAQGLCLYSDEGKSVAQGQDYFLHTVV